MSLPMFEIACTNERELTYSAQMKPNENKFQAFLSQCTFIWQVQKATTAMPSTVAAAKIVPFCLELR